MKGIKKERRVRGKDKDTKRKIPPVEFQLGLPSSTRNATGYVT
jgi:hypothetical protein